MVPASRLPIEEGDRVLDLCAAPGGKSTELAARLRGTGLLVSNDISRSRAQGLLKNLELFGAGNILVTSETPESLLGNFEGFFDKILVDASLFRGRHVPERQRYGKKLDGAWAGILCADSAGDSSYSR